MDGRLACCAAHAATELLEKVYRVPVDKAIDPLTDSGFLRIVAQLTRSLRRATAGAEAEALSDAIDELDVDWEELDADGREQIFQAAARALDAIPPRVMPRIEETFRVAGPSIAGEARQRTASRYGFTIGASLSEPDREAVAALRQSTTNFIRDQYGVRRDELAQVARESVARGLEQGLGSDSIASGLRTVLEQRGIQRSQDYWQVVSMQFTNSARTYAQLSAYDAAGVTEYVFEAILDEVTSDVCRFYHGKVFQVGPALEHSRKTMRASPEQVYELNPWVRTGQDEDGNSVLYAEQGGEQVVVAEIERSGVGTSDDTGSYSSALSPEQLQGMGIPYPPLHAHCRSTVVPRI